MPRLNIIKFRILNSLYYRIANTDYSCLFCCLDYFFRRILGRFLIFFVYSILSFFVFTAITIVLPFEALHRSVFVIIPLVFFAIYLIVNIVYHYYKASTIHPGNPPKVLLEPLCRHCHSYKPFGTHHCIICNSCILKMDHHCIWINQCVGAKNHRHFLQFLAFIIIGCATFIIVASNTFYYNYWHRFTNNEYCNVEGLSSLPWFLLFCEDDSMIFITSIIFFTYFLCIIVFFLVSSLFYWNFVLISAGYTYIGILQEKIEFREILRILAFPLKHTKFFENWRRFLGLRHGSERSFFCQILFPSSHESFVYEEDMPKILDLVNVVSNRNAVVVNTQTRDNQQQLLESKTV